MRSQLFRVLPDTNVCYPMSLLDLVLRCDEYDLHRVVWTEDVLNELVKVWVRNGARSKASAEAVANQIRNVFPDQQVGRTRYEQLIAEMPGPDKNDHVHAAAAVAVAPSVLLTANTKDFPAQALATLGVTVRHPDEYFVKCLAAEPETMREILVEMSADRQHPRMTVTQVIGALEGAGLVGFAAAFNAT